VNFKLLTSINDAAYSSTPHVATAGLSCSPALHVRALSFSAAAALVQILAGSSCCVACANDSIALDLPCTYTCVHACMMNTVRPHRITTE
jgi:hypothetical protein